MSDIETLQYVMRAFINTIDYHNIINYIRFVDCCEMEFLDLPKTDFTVIPKRITVVVTPE